MPLHKRIPILPEDRELGRQEGKARYPFIRSHTGTTTLENVMAGFIAEAAVQRSLGQEPQFRSDKTTPDHHDIMNGNYIFGVKTTRDASRDECFYNHRQLMLDIQRVGGEYDQLFTAIDGDELVVYGWMTQREVIHYPERPNTNGSEGTYHIIPHNKLHATLSRWPDKPKHEES